MVTTVLAKITIFPNSQYWTQGGDVLAVHVYYRCCGNVNVHWIVPLAWHLSDILCVFCSTWQVLRITNINYKWHFLSHHLIVWIISQIILCTSFGSVFLNCKCSTGPEELPVQSVGGGGPEDPHGDGPQLHRDPQKQLQWGKRAVKEYHDILCNKYIWIQTQ